MTGQRARLAGGPSKIRDDGDGLQPLRSSGRGGLEESRPGHAGPGHPGDHARGLDRSGGHGREGRAAAAGAGGEAPLTTRPSGSARGGGQQPRGRGARSQRSRWSARAERVGSPRRSRRTGKVTGMVQVELVPAAAARRTRPRCSRFCSLAAPVAALRAALAAPGRARMAAGGGEHGAVLPGGGILRARRSCGPSGWPSADGQRPWRDRGGGGRPGARARRRAAGPSTAGRGTRDLFAEAARPGERRRGAIDREKRRGRGAGGPAARRSGACSRWRAGPPGAGGRGLRRRAPPGAGAGRATAQAYAYIAPAIVGMIAAGLLPVLLRHRARFTDSNIYNTNQAALGALGGPPELRRHPRRLRHRAPGRGRALGLQLPELLLDASSSP